MYYISIQQKALCNDPSFWIFIVCCNISSTIPTCWCFFFLVALPPCPPLCPLLHLFLWHVVSALATPPLHLLVHPHLFVRHQLITSSVTVVCNQCQIEELIRIYLYLHRSVGYYDSHMTVMWSHVLMQVMYVVGRFVTCIGGVASLDARAV